jgi:hypothetical protein
VHCFTWSCSADGAAQAASWVSLGDSLVVSNVAVAAQNTDRLHVFARFADEGALHYKIFFNGGWDVAWLHFGNIHANGSPAVAVPAMAGHHILAVMCDALNSFRVEQCVGGSMSRQLIL